MIKIAVILTVYNRREVTLKGLRTLYKAIEYLQKEQPNEGYRFDIYMTDDGSTDGTGEAVKTEFPNVHISQGDGNLYWNGGMRKAWQTAIETGEKYDFYLWYNDDVNIYDFSLSRLMKDSRSFNNMCIVVGATSLSDGVTLSYGGRIKGKIPPCEGSVHKVDYFNGNIVLIPQVVFEQLGNLDSYYTHSKGDFDYGLRAKKAGITMIQCGDVLGVCELHPSLSAWCNPQIPLSARWAHMVKPNGMPPKESFYFNRRHFGLWSGIKVFCLIHLRCLFPFLWLILKKSK